MKFLSHPFISSLSTFFYRVYQFATICIVVGSPLFFIPHTVFAPETTYFVTITIFTVIALISYIINALISGEWNRISRLELIAYTSFSLAVVISSIFSRNIHGALFGETLSSVSGAALISLPVVVYLVRSLPAVLRRKLKYVLIGILGVSALLFMFSVIYAGKASEILGQLFYGFSDASSFAVYMGIFTVACLFFIKKVVLPTHHKIIIAVTSILFLIWVISFSSQNIFRPNFSSTYEVGKQVMINNGPFGIGPTNFSRAWQLYRPENVILSKYFGFEFDNGSDTVSTMLSTVGIVGLLSFLVLIFSALYSTYRSYRKTESGLDHFILGVTTFVLLYFTIVAFIVPLTYAMFVLWMVVAGLGVAKEELEDHHPTVGAAVLMIPVAILLIVNSYFLVQKAQAFALYSKLTSTSSKEQVIKNLTEASTIYPFDGFYREMVEFYISLNRELVSSSLTPTEIEKQYLDNTTRAIDSAKNAIRINSDNYRNYISLGRAYELAIPFKKETEYANAKKAYEEAIKIYPGNPYIYLMLARLEASAGTKEGVRARLNDALKKKQNFADALYLMSQLEASEEKIDEALSYAIEAIKNAPEDPLTYVQAGLLLYGKGDYDNAVLALKSGLEKDPNNANIAYFLSIALRENGRPDIAIPIVDQLIKLNPKNTTLETLRKSLNNTKVKSTATTTPASPVKK